MTCVIKQALSRLCIAALIVTMSWLPSLSASATPLTVAALNISNSGLSSPEAPATAVFSGGCFWCMEQPFDALPGVIETTSGYAGGQVENPTYYEVSAGKTGHLESMKVTYDPSKVSYDVLLETFWHNIDPFDSRGQFCDKGSQYRSAIFYSTSEQKELAESTKQTISGHFDQPVATEILPATTFYPAEDYHQDYYQTHPMRYKVYRFGCGRDQRLNDLWGDAAPTH